MATRHGRSKPFARLRCDALEPRLTPAAAPVLDFGGGFTQSGLPGGVPAGYAANDLLLTDEPFQATAVWAPTRVDLRAFQTSFVFRLDGEPGRLGDGFTFALAAAPRRRAPRAAGSGTEGSPTAWRSSSTWWTTPGRGPSRSGCSPAGPSRPPRP